MSLALKALHPEELSDFSRLREDVRRDILMWIEAITEISGSSRGAMGHVIASVCARMGVTQGTVYRKIEAYKERGWLGLVNNAKCPESGLPPAFKAWVESLHLRNQRDTSGAAVQRIVIDQWSLWRRSGDPQHALPGYTMPPAPSVKGYPSGFSAKNLNRLKPCEHNRKLTRQGTKAASEFLPSILKTRVGLRFGQVVFFDDQDYDQKIVAPGLSQKAMRPQGFNALDYLSGSFIDYVIRSRYLDADTDTVKSLNQRDFVWFVIHVLSTVGYRNDDEGTVFVFEHGTASGYSNDKLETANGISKFDDALAFVTGGKLRVERSGLFNQPAFAGMLFRPQSSGNFRFKSPIESMFNLVRNESSMLLGQIGLNARSHGPEENYGLDIYTTQLLNAFLTLPAERQEMMRWPLHTLAQFGQLYANIYETINARTDHALEGWEQCGHVVPLIRLAPDDAAPWMTPAQLAKLPARTQELALSLLDEPGYTMPHRLSPRQVVDMYKSELTKLPKSAVPLLIPRQWAREVTVKSDRSITIQDQLAGPEPFSYICRIITRNGAEMLRPGLKLLARFNPSDPTELCISDENDRYIGHLTATSRVNFLDHETMVERLGERSAIKADLEAPVRAAMASTMQDRMDMKAHNDRLITGAPVTEEELAAARSESAQQSASTRRHRTWAEHLDQDFMANAMKPESIQPTIIDDATIASYLED
jgi:hypothetical protein